MTLIVLFLIAVLAITVGTTLLTKDVELRWALGPVLQLLTAAVLTVVSGICLNTLPNVFRAIWQLPAEKTTRLAKVGRELKKALGVPARWVVVGVAAAALVAAGVVIRPEPTGLEPGELVVMSAFGSDPGDARTMLLNQWNRLNPRNHARFDYAPVSSDQQHERMVDDATGEHKADLYVLDIVWMAEFTQRDYIQPLDESMLEQKDLGDFVPKVLQTAEDENGELWALPLNSDAGLMYYRTDIPGISYPRTWDDYFGAGAKIAVATARAQDPKIQAANAAQLGVGDEMLTITALEATWAAGGRVVGPNGQLALTPDGRRVDFQPTDLTGLQKLAAAAKDLDIVPPDAGSMTAEAATQAFADHRTEVMRNWPVARDVLEGKVRFNAVAPPTPSVLGGQNVAISARTDKPRAAQALLQFLTSGASEQILSEVGGFMPTRQSAFDYSRRPDMAQLKAALDDARLRPVTPCYVKFSQLFREGIDRALNNNGKLEADFASQLARLYNCS